MPRPTRREPQPLKISIRFRPQIDAELISANAVKSGWISKARYQDRETKGNSYRRKADLCFSKTDPDAPPMKRKGGNHSHLGHQAHSVVDGARHA